MSQTVSLCCVQGFKWDGTSVGHEGTLAKNNAYITGSNSKIAILYVADILSWKYPNARLMADHFAAEVGATVYVPDFYDGEILPLEKVLAGDFADWAGRNSREKREPEIFACAQALRDQGYEKVGAVGYCFGGWATLRLGAQEHVPKLADAIVCAQPSWVTERDLQEVVVPTQFLCPEFDQPFDAMKKVAWETLQKNKIVFDYVHFPGANHGDLVRGDIRTKEAKDNVERGKNAAVWWLRQWLLKEE